MDFSDVKGSASRFLDQLVEEEVRAPATPTRALYTCFSLSFLPRAEKDPSFWQTEELHTEATGLFTKEEGHRRESHRGNSRGYV